MTNDGKGKMSYRPTTGNRQHVYGGGNHHGADVSSTQRPGKASNPSGPRPHGQGLHFRSLCQRLRRIRDADSRQRHQDLVKRVGLHEGFGLGVDGGTAFVDSGEHARQLGQDDGRGVRADNGHALLAQGLDDVIGEAFAHPGRELGQPVPDPAPSCVAKRFGAQQHSARP